MLLSQHKFEGYQVFASTIGRLKKGAAFVFPGIGIFVNPDDVNNNDLLRHEYGHILQAKKWGLWFFYSRIVPVSLWSASKHGKNKFRHPDTWTEWSANQLSYSYFNKPTDWNFEKYPIRPEVSREGSMLPKKLHLDI